MEKTETKWLYLTHDWLFVCVNACVCMSFQWGEVWVGVCVCQHCMHLHLAMSNSDGQIDCYIVKLGIPFFAAQASIDFL